MYNVYVYIHPAYIYFVYHSLDHSHNKIISLLEKQAIKNIIKLSIISCFANI